MLNKLHLWNINILIKLNNLDISSFENNKILFKIKYLKTSLN